ncbi:MAG TPA: hypothetical protein VGB98_18165 [Pyrinomonadaceae bacterium]
MEVVRPDDLLVVTLDFYNFKLTPAAGAPRLERKGAGHGFIIARLPPQSFGERAFFEATPGPGGDTSEPLDAPAVPVRISDSSELVFRVTDALLPLDFTLETILDLLTRSETVVQPTIQLPAATPPINGQSRFGGQRAKFTAVEAPYRLILSPSLESRWQHAAGPVSDAAGKRTELWHTRLSAGATAGAVWSPDYEGDPSLTNEPFRMSLNSSYRQRIVRSSADKNLAGARHVNVEQLMLSSQGAWLKVHGEWDAALTGLDLIEWRHVMTAGRDQYARVVEEGYLFWPGNLAVIVTITERKVEMGRAGQTEGKPVAYLRQIKKIFLREPTKTYTHRHMPYRTVTIKTPVTPNLDDPALGEILPGEADHAFWPRVANEDFLFHVVATDWEGRESEFLAPLAFVIRSTADAPLAPGSKMTRIIEKYNALPESDPRRSRPIGGQKVAYAPSQMPGDTTLETFSIIFGASGATGGLPHFLPLMSKASVDVPAARIISGNTAPSTIALDQKYVADGGDVIGNMGDVFAYLVGTRTPVEFTTDKTGGTVAPDFSISGISRAFGPVGGDIGKFADGDFNPADIFKAVKILGGIDLASIISDAINATPATAGDKIPQLKSVRKTVSIRPGEPPKDVIETSYRWVVDESFLINTGMFVPKAGSVFLIEAFVYAPLDGTPPVFKVDGRITNFSVVLLPSAELVEINFDAVTFSAGTDKKVDFGVIFKGFDFLGSLSFVNKLREVIPMDGFDDPPFLNIVLPPEPRPGVNAGFTLGIPTVGIGIFTLQNISFSAGFYLPFLGDEANLRLAFCERHQPFILTVSLFGGGGFFGIDIGMGGVRMIEAALEFGAAVALNLGVAKGTASIMGGVYYQKSGDGFAFSAYFRAAGALSVLGIITVSVELYISLNFESRKSQPHGGKLWGQASLTVKIKIAFFSVSVKIGIEREFAGSDPKLIDTVTPSDWTEYCAAFADYPA